MTIYFSSEERRNALLREARLWDGTPFHPHAMVRGSGVDCASLALAIYQGVGLLGEIELPKYSMDGGSHLSTSIALRTIEASGRFLRVDSPEKIAGDLLVMKIGRVEHHLGLRLYGDTFIHAIRRQGVCLGNASDPPYCNRITATFRPIET